MNGVQIYMIFVRVLGFFLTIIDILWYCLTLIDILCLIHLNCFANKIIFEVRTRLLMYFEHYSIC